MIIYYYFKAKQDIRSIRKETLDLIKKCKGLVSDDDSKRASKDVKIMFIILYIVSNQ